MSPAPACPACGQRTLNRHCPPTNPSCTWDSCVNPFCKASIDRVTGRHTHPSTTPCKTCTPREKKP